MAEQENGSSPLTGALAGSVTCDHEAREAAVSYL